MISNMRNVLLPFVLSMLAWSGQDVKIEKQTLSLQEKGIEIQLWKGPGKEGAKTPFYAISRDGKTITRETSYRLMLRAGSFDPLEVNANGENNEANPEGLGLHVVQFITQPLDLYRKAVEDLGGTIRFYLPRHAYLVHLGPEAVVAVRALPFVRWVGPYQPAWRIERELTDRAGAERLRYNIMASGRDQKTSLVDQVVALGGAVVHADAGKYLIEAELNRVELLTVIALDEVAYIDLWSPMGTDMDRIREVSGANYVETVAGYTGQGVRGEVIDLGFNTNHVGFASRPLIEHTPVGSNIHGAATSGIIFGDGTGNAQARGLLPDGQGIVADCSVFLEPGRYTHTGELPQAPFFAVFQSSSVGTTETTQYTTFSADIDAMLFDFDVLHLQSQGNRGNMFSRPQAWAKNILSVGGVRQHHTNTTADDCWCTTASTGPAEDGRIKPDLVHAYDGVFTVGAPGPTSYNSSFCCTSSATPMTAGLAGLAFQMWSEGIFGNAVTPGASVFENRPKMTMIKALLINTAQKYAFTGTGQDLGRFHQGWGVASVADLYDARERIFTVDETDVLANMEQATYMLEVLANEPVLRATMTYADPPAVPSATIHRINDLSLKVTSPLGTVYWGNNGLLEGNESTPDGVPNEIDTVENVFVSAPSAGIWTVEVFAHEINEDGHVETPEADADFALVVTGVTFVAPTCIADLNKDEIIDMVDFQIAVSRWPGAVAGTDLNGDGNLDTRDLIIWLDSFGECPSRR